MNLYSRGTHFECQLGYQLNKNVFTCLFVTFYSFCLPSSPFKDWVQYDEHIKWRRKDCGIALPFVTWENLSSTFLQYSYHGNLGQIILMLDGFTVQCKMIMSMVSSDKNVNCQIMANRREMRVKEHTWQVFFSAARDGSTMIHWGTRKTTLMMEVSLILQYHGKGHKVFGTSHWPKKTFWTMYWTAVKFSTN